MVEEQEQPDIGRKALYNSLRLLWLNEPGISAEPWQVEDYRGLSVDALFQRLNTLNCVLNEQAFLAYAENVNSPEELAELLAAERPTEERDRIFLLLFELWRKLGHDFPCLSILCDELDFQISAYDSNPTGSLESLQDALATFRTILDENVDQGTEPYEAFQIFTNECANDIENFLYDFCTDLIEAGSYDYAQDLVEGFYDYIDDVAWFDFLRARLLLLVDSEEAEEILSDLLQDEEPLDFALGMDILSYLLERGPQALFENYFRMLLPSVQMEEELREMLHLSVEHFQAVGRDDVSEQLTTLIDARKERALRDHVQPEDEAVRRLSHLF